MNLIYKWDERACNVGVWCRRRFILSTIFGDVPNDGSKVGTGGEISVCSPAKCNGGVRLVQHWIVGGGAKSVILRVSGLGVVNELYLKAGDTC